jgi:Holliday junction resolvase RusA-like endonuclease
MDAIAFTILGQPASKSNRSQIITIAGHSSLVKSKEAIAYERDALRQIPATARRRLEGPVRVTLRIWYTSELSDLDESLVLDCLQDRKTRTKKDTEGNVVRASQLVQAGVYRNDRQVREKHVFHGIDRRNPRVEVCVEPLQAQQEALL